MIAGIKKNKTKQNTKNDRDPSRYFIQSTPPTQNLSALIFFQVSVK